VKFQFVGITQLTVDLVKRFDEYGLRRSVVYGEELSGMVSTCLRLLLASGGGVSCTTGDIARQSRNQ